MSKKVHYKFECPDFEDVCQYKPTTFYQICCFQNPDTDKYEARKYKIDCNNNFSSVKIVYFSQRKYDKFISEMPSNKYKVFNTYTLGFIDHPNLSDIDLSRSELMK